ncbi:hypothetical protein CYMTET_40357 [Cymbomonas tetramitiformis]|uniref:Uncharacterized protein n=1 Tax=Cymbomonas tetramitiformis TaxID=36881 RepID=A0AAE0C890_9CHLO|nr:hypothetical protein CYMTET_40357 [Cymbomonas tetramitiformis]
MLEDSPGEVEAPLVEAPPARRARRSPMADGFIFFQIFNTCFGELETFPPGAVSSQLLLEGWSVAGPDDGVALYHADVCYTSEVAQIARKARALSRYIEPGQDYSGMAVFSVKGISNGAGSRGRQAQVDGGCAGLEVGRLQRHSSVPVVFEVEGSADYKPQNYSRHEAVSPEVATTLHRMLRAAVTRGTGRPAASEHQNVENSLRELGLRSGKTEQAKLCEQSGRVLLSCTTESRKPG